MAYVARQRQIDKDAVSAIICRHVIELPEYQSARTVLWYLHCRSEVRTLPAVLAQLPSEKRIAIPFCTQDEKGQPCLGLWHLQDIGELQAGMWGILEPPPVRWTESAKTIAPEELDLLMVPGVAFDCRGGRLGNGAGYYDRLLPKVRSDATLVGVCYQAQILPQIVCEPHDVAMDMVITEQAVYQGRGCLNNRQRAS